MAYYSNHNLAYDFTLFEEPFDNGAVARVRKKAGDSEKTAAVKGTEKRKENTAPSKSIRPQKRRKNNFVRIGLSIVLGLAVMFTIASIIHGWVQLTELSQEIDEAKIELEEKTSIYTQLEMKVDASISTTAVEQFAKEQLMMTKANNAQKEFINLSDGDKAEVTMKKEKNLFEKIGDWFSDLISSIWS